MCSPQFNPRLPPDRTFDVKMWLYLAGACAMQWLLLSAVAAEAAARPAAAGTGAASVGATALVDLATQSSLAMKTFVGLMSYFLVCTPAVRWRLRGILSISLPLQPKTASPPPLAPTTSLHSRRTSLSPSLDTNERSQCWWQCLIFSSLFLRPGRWSTCTGRSRTSTRTTSSARSLGSSSPGAASSSTPSTTRCGPQTAGAAVGGGGHCSLAAHGVGVWQLLSRLPSSLCARGC